MFADKEYAPLLSDEKVSKLYDTDVISGLNAFKLRLATRIEEETTRIKGASKTGADKTGTPPPTASTNTNTNTTDKTEVIGNPDAGVRKINGNTVLLNNSPESNKMAFAGFGLFNNINKPFSGTNQGTTFFSKNDLFSIQGEPTEPNTIVSVKGLFVKLGLYTPGADGAFGTFLSVNEAKPKIDAFIKAILPANADETLKKDVVNIISLYYQGLIQEQEAALSITPSLFRNSFRHSRGISWIIEHVIFGEKRNKGEAVKVDARRIEEAMTSEQGGNNVLKKYGVISDSFDSENPGEGEFLSNATLEALDKAIADGYFTEDEVNKLKTSINNPGKDGTYLNRKIFSYGIMKDARFIQFLVDYNVGGIQTVNTLENAFLEELFSKFEKEAGKTVAKMKEDYLRLQWYYVSAFAVDTNKDNFQELIKTRLENIKDVKSQSGREPFDSTFLNKTGTRTLSDITKEIEGRFKVGHPITVLYNAFSQNPLFSDSVINFKSSASGQSYMTDADGKITLTTVPVNRETIAVKTLAH